MTPVFSTSARRVLAAAVLMAFFSLGCMVSRPLCPRPDSWAAPVSVEGVPNLFRVSENLYRSAQPTREGFRNLAKMGIRTVVTFRGGHADRALTEGAGLTLVEIPMPDIRPETGQVVQLLKILRDDSRSPVLVHCLKGADRTGAMIAAYRITLEGWTKDEAIDEMTGGGYGFHVIWTNLAPFVRSLDTEKLRAAVSAASPDPKPEIEGAAP